MPINYHLFQVELEQLIQYCHKHSIRLVVITTPIDYSSAPKKVCDDVRNSEYTQLETRVKRKIKEGDFKRAYTLLKQSAHLSIGNAGYHYLMARVAYALNNIEKAWEHAQLSVSLDCLKWRSDDTFNNILIDKAKENDLILFDFNLLVSQNFMEKETFLDQIFPQDLYYQKAVKALGVVLRKVLKI